MRYDHDEEGWQEDDTPATPKQAKFFATGLAYGVVFGVAVGLILGAGI